jgi:hypothetical protein
MAGREVALMRRTLVGACIGAVCGVFALAGSGAWGGYTHGADWVAAPAPPPAESAVLWAFRFLAYFWWLAAGVGGVIGGLAGLGSWLVRPKPPSGTGVAGH